MTDAAPGWSSTQPGERAADAGRWTASDVEQLQPSAAGDAVLRHGEPRLSRHAAAVADRAGDRRGGVRPRGARTPRAAGAVGRDGQRQRRGAAPVGSGRTVLVRGAEQARGGLAAAGDVVARAPAGAAVHLQLRCSTRTSCPTVHHRVAGAGWLGSARTRRELLGMAAGSAAYDPGRTPAQLMTQRRAVIAERAGALLRRRAAADRARLAPAPDGRRRRALATSTWSTTWRCIGHAHPRLAAAVARQWALLNTNSRFHYARHRRALRRGSPSSLPAALDTVFLVNSGSEAVDLALRLAQAAHADGATSSRSARPTTAGPIGVRRRLHLARRQPARARPTRPDWVHTVLAPNTFRGAYRGAQAAHATPRRRTAIDGHGRRRPPARRVHLRARLRQCRRRSAARRLPRTASTTPSARSAASASPTRCRSATAASAHYFWGFEQQGVVPDIVDDRQGRWATASRSARSSPAARSPTSFAREGHFFSSAGGSPVSCRRRRWPCSTSWRDEEPAGQRAPDRATPARQVRRPRRAAPGRIAAGRP